MAILILPSDFSSSLFWRRDVTSHPRRLENPSDREREESPRDRPPGRSRPTNSHVRETSPSRRRRRRRLNATFRVTVSRRHSAAPRSSALLLIPYDATLADEIVTIDRYAQRSREKLNSRISTDRRWSPLVF